MSEIIPRWEWRSFGRRFPSAEERLARLTPSGVQESDEIYLLSASGDNVKVRDALMDVKVLQEINADGLEQWTPVMKAGFPLSASRHGEGPGCVASVGAGRRCATATRSRNSSKRLPVRAAAFGSCGSTSGACATRSTAAWPSFRTSWRTASPPVRSPSNPRMRRAVVRAVAGLGLGGYANISYPRALAAPDRRRAGALRRHRRRDELGQVPHRRAGRRRGRGGPSSIAPR